MPAQEMFQDVGEFAGNRVRIEGENAIYDVIGTRLVGRVQIARFDRWLERPHDHPGWIGAQIKRLPVQEGSLGQGILGLLDQEVKVTPPRRAVPWVLSAWC